jgi:hypothetical protein
LPNSHRHTISAPCGPIDAPAELKPFAEPSFLLPGENARDFEVIRQMMVDDIRPQTNIEWLWTLDIVELSWEILRYRRLKDRVLNAHRAAAIEAILLRLDGEGMPTEAMPMVQIQAKRTATEWRDDQEAAGEIEARLRQSGVDHIDINAEVFVQARVVRNVRSTHAAGSVPAHRIAARNQHPPRICQPRPACHEGGGRFVMISQNGWLQNSQDDT